MLHGDQAPILFRPCCHISRTTFLSSSCLYSCPMSFLSQKPKSCSCVFVALRLKSASRCDHCGQLRVCLPSHRTLRLCRSLGAWPTHSVGSLAERLLPCSSSARMPNMPASHATEDTPFTCTASSFHGDARVGCSCWNAHLQCKSKLDFGLGHLASMASCVDPTSAPRVRCMEEIRLPPTDPLLTCESSTLCGGWQQIPRRCP